MEFEENKKFKILVVDDIPKNIQVLGNILKKADYLAGFAINGKQAMDILQNANDYDLVLLDINMPVMNGFDVCRAMREDTRLKEIPVIFLTAYTDTENIVKGFNAGAQDYVTKPFNSKELLARVDTHLRLKQKSDQVRNLNTLLNEKNKNITRSIVYASSIQQSMLPPAEILKNNIPDSFILYKPKDIVSGDFYWFKQTRKLIYIVAADCTGHGIPGAFLSILALARLNEIFKEKQNVKFARPGEILNELRKRIIKSLHQNEQEVESNDGLDIAFCIIDLENYILQFSGANNPLLLIRKNLDNNFELIEKKGDRMPVGMHLRDKEDFINHEIKIQDGDIFYIFSDGYLSQFDREGKKLFSSKRFQETLLKNQDKPMETQKQILEQTLAEWQGKYEQIDDILVIGMRINI
ncbi:MAG: response regulator [Bacteroidales bacterium]|nr:response regulator [Bacteroidales bacterium]